MYMSRYIDYVIIIRTIIKNKKVVCIFESSGIRFVENQLIFFFFSSIIFVLLSIHLLLSHFSIFVYKNVKVDQRDDLPLPVLHQEETHSFSSTVTRTLVSRATTRAKLHRSFFTRIKLEKNIFERYITKVELICHIQRKERREGGFCFFFEQSFATFLRTAING